MTDPKFEPPATDAEIVEWTPGPYIAALSMTTLAVCGILTLACIGSPAIQWIQGQQRREPARGIARPYLIPPTTPPLSEDTAQLRSWETWTATAYSGLCILPRPGIPEPTTTQRTASGVYPVPNWSIAADRRYAYGTVLLVSHGGIVTSRIVHDRGRAIKGKRLDLYMEDCHRARKWGVRRVMVRVLTEPLGGTRTGEGME